MSWEEGDGKLCQMISNGRIAAGAEGDDYKSFQGLAESLRAFQSVGLIENLVTEPEHCTGHGYIAMARWRIPPEVMNGKITSGQRRWLLLRFFAECDEEDEGQLFAPDQDTFARLAGTTSKIGKAGCWLRENGFIHWEEFLSDSGAGWILDKGYEALDHGLDMLSERRMPIMNVVDQRNQSVNVGTLNAGAGDLAIGHNATINKQVLAEELAKLFEAIKQAPGDEVEKRTLLTGLKKSLAHPMVNTVTGGMLSGILS